MKKFEVTARVPKIGKIKHIIRAEDRDEAKEKMKQAHPEAVELIVGQLEGASDT